MYLRKYLVTQIIVQAKATMNHHLFFQFRLLSNYIMENIGQVKVFVESRFCVICKALPVLKVTRSFFKTCHNI